MCTSTVSIRKNEWSQTKWLVTQRYTQCMQQILKRHHHTHGTIMSRTHILQIHAYLNKKVSFPVLYILYMMAAEVVGERKCQCYIWTHCLQIKKWGYSHKAYVLRHRAMKYFWKKITRFGVMAKYVAKISKWWIHLWIDNILHNTYVLKQLFNFSG